MLSAPRAIALGIAGLLLAVISGSPVAGQGSVTRETIATRLSFPAAIAISEDPAPGYPAGTIFYSERFTGRIRALVDGALLPNSVAAVPVVTGGEQGLLGLAVDPNFATDPWLYVYHTYMNGTLGEPANRVVRFSLASPPVPPAPPRMEVVLDPIPAATVHNGGVIEFAPDGTLLVTTGDAVSPANSQDLGTRAGKILRVNPDGSIPSDNPFLGDPSADPTVYTYGHRNVFGLAFHPVTGRAYITENGPQCNDEINLLIAGRNYGWGPSQTCSTPPDPPANTNRDGPNPVPPIAWYGSVIAPTGLAFYGAANSSWRNALLVGDWNRGVLQRLDLGGANFDTVLSSEIADTVGSGGILDVETGPDGTVYVSTSEAILRYIAPADGGAVPPSSGVSPILYAVLAILVGVALLAVWTVVRERRRS